MASIKVKFRSSTIEGKKGVIYYQVISNRVVRQISTKYRIYTTEWDSKMSVILLSSSITQRRKVLANINHQVTLDIQRLNQIVKQLELRNSYFDTDTIVKEFEKELGGDTLFKFMHIVIARLKELRKERCVETYSTTLKSFIRFREGEDILLKDIDSDLMISYQAYLKEKGISTNTISFYNRVIRAVYNRAVEQELIEQRYPFKRVYTGVRKTAKRALPIKYIKMIKEIDLTQKPKMRYARDMFLLSFYTRGMSFVDMAYLRKKDMQNGIISYRRRKTGQQLHIKWEVCMQEIMESYPLNTTDYIFPIITEKAIDERSYYKNELAKINKQLNKLSLLLSLQIPLTMYVARHSWASIAKSKNIPLSVISEGMGHDSEATTQIYLASLDTAVVDRANSMILNLLI